MAKILVIVHTELKERLKRKGFWITTLLFPVIFLAPFFIATQGSPANTQNQKLLVVHDKTSELLPSVFKELESEHRFKPVAFKTYDSATLKRIYDDIRQGIFWGVLELNKTPENGLKVKLVYSGSVSSYQQAMLKRSLQVAALNVELEKKGILEKDAFTFSAERIESDTQRSDFSQFIVSYFMGLLIYITMLVYGIQVMNAVIFEKSTRIMEILISSVTPLELMIGKICGVGLAALVQYAIWGLMVLGVFFTSAWVDENFRIMIQAALPFELIGFLLVYFVLGYLMYASLYGAIGALVEHQQDAQSLHFPVTFLVILPVLILPQVISNPQATWVSVLSQIPFFSPTLMVSRLAAGQIALWEILLSLSLLIAAFFGISVIAGKIYRIGVLSYGQKPTLKTLFRYLKQ